MKLKIDFILMRQKCKRTNAHANQFLGTHAKHIYVRFNCVSGTIVNLESLGRLTNDVKRKSEAKKRAKTRVSSIFGVSLIRCNTTLRILILYVVITSAAHIINRFGCAWVKK